MISKDKPVGGTVRPKSLIYSHIQHNSSQISMDRRWNKTELECNIIKFSFDSNSPRRCHGTPEMTETTRNNPKRLETTENGISVIGQSVEYRCRSRVQ